MVFNVTFTNGFQTSSQLGSHKDFRLSSWLNSQNDSRLYSMVKVTKGFQTIFKSTSTEGFQKVVMVNFKQRDSRLFYCEVLHNVPYLLMLTTSLTHARLVSVYLS